MLDKKVAGESYRVHPEVHRVGDAQISHIHANIMVNLGNATAKDVRELITIAQQAVEKKFDLHLDVEISFVGEFN